LYDETVIVRADAVEPKGITARYVRAVGAMIKVPTLHLDNRQGSVPVDADGLDVGEIVRQGLEKTSWDNVVTMNRLQGNTIIYRFVKVNVLRQATGASSIYRVLNISGGASFTGSVAFKAPVA
jgi:hypothetical protein